jgi:hypothetical protein
MKVQYYYIQGLYFFRQHHLTWLVYWTNNVGRIDALTLQGAMSVEESHPSPSCAPTLARARPPASAGARPRPSRPLPPARPLKEAPRLTCTRRRPAARRRVACACLLSLHCRSVHLRSTHPRVHPPLTGLQF